MKKFTYILIGLIVLVGIVYVIIAPPRVVASKYDSFATCIKDSGAVFYGAFWCPHCQAEKARFGSSEKFLPYVECSTPDGQGQTQICKDKGIETYPTWQFANSTTTVVGELELTDLAQKTSCPLPQ
jgi:thiol-disulfide isomerase/thioredoxin